jgi:hypothetical protein
MPTPVASFGPEHTRRDAPEAAAVAEEVIVSMIEHAKRFDVDPAGVASLVMFDAAARLAPMAARRCQSFWPRSAAPFRPVNSYCAANERGVAPPPLNVARLQDIAPDACRLH